LHLFDMEHGFLGTNGIVGAGLPLATGAALASKLEDVRFVVVAFFGDGAMNTGAAHEALNLAAAWKLPLVFVCENNHYAVSTSVTSSTAIEHLSQRAGAYGMPGRTIDGNDVLAVFQGAQEARARASAGDGPTLLECLTYRHKGHSRFEPAAYRSKEELESWLARDPIATFCQRVEVGAWLPKGRVDALRQEVADEVSQAVRFAHESEDMNPGQAAQWVYAE
jgi:pyruvate dehydrogenase E1 component alpha subunit